jgi:hypothetical protein
MKEYEVYVLMRVTAPDREDAMRAAQAAANQVQTYDYGESRVTSANVSSARRSS